MTRGISLEGADVAGAGVMLAVGKGVGEMEKEAKAGMVSIVGGAVAIASVGALLDAMLGAAVGPLVGATVGALVVANIVGELVGIAVGAAVLAVGDSVGLPAWISSPVGSMVAVASEGSNVEGAIVVNTPVLASASSLFLLSSPPSLLVAARAITKITPMVKTKRRATIQALVFFVSAAFSLLDVSMGVLSKAASSRSGSSTVFVMMTNSFPSPDELILRSCSNPIVVSRAVSTTSVVHVLVVPSETMIRAENVLTVPPLLVPLIEWASEKMGGSDSCSLLRWRRPNFTMVSSFNSYTVFVLFEKVFPKVNDERDIRNCTWTPVALMR